MEATASTVRLARAGPSAEALDGVLASISRREIEEVLQAGERPVEMVIDVAQARNGGVERPDVETHTLKVMWQGSDLEKILQETDGDEVALAFERDELEKALATADVEGHGLRERALILTVAAATATGGIAATQAAGAGGGQAASGQASEISTGLAPSGADPVSASEVSSGIVPEASARAPAEVTSGLAPTAEPAAPSEVSSGLVPDEPARAPAEVTAGLGPGTVEPAPASEVSTGIVPDAGARAPAEVTTGLAPTSSGPRAVPVDATGGSGSFPVEEVAILGGLALTITAASFVIRGQRHRAAHS